MAQWQVHARATSAHLEVKLSSYSGALSTTFFTHWLSKARIGLYHWRMLVKPLILLLSGLLLQFAAHAAQPPRIAAASSLQYVLPDIVAAFQRKTGTAVRVTYGSSGNFRRQIAQGAPFELFLSADEYYAEDLVRLGLTIDSSRAYAFGRIAVIAPKGGALELDQELTALRAAIENGSLMHFAIANPDHAPYGRAAREALTSLGLWQPIQPYLVKGENASQATQFAISGSSDGGIVPYTFARFPAIAGSSKTMLIPQSLHLPIRQHMVLVRGAGETSRQFFDFLGEEEALAIFVSHGYGVSAH